MENEKKTLHIQNRYEPIAQNQQRSYINAGYQVSLIAYNPKTDTYDFYVYNK